LSTTLDHPTGRKLLPFDEAAHRLGIGITKLRELIDAGQIDTVRIGTKRRLIPVESVDAYADNLPRETNTATRPDTSSTRRHPAAGAATGTRKR
jgi:excisionase family DNA binding protein